ncbi:MAG: T9SS type A sorting domain-containing protein [Flavobacteriales bacterium]|nr:T9SS type A sorting domain-containing protein [Flavobacteriales bacterium]
MKRLLLFLVASIALSVNAQTTLQIAVEHRVNGEEFTWESIIQNNLGMDFTISRFEYYMSGFSITHDGGTVTAFDEVYGLFNINVSDILELGQINAENIEMISFYIGVDEQNNHADPAIWPAGHPLAPRFPSMHWGWAAGYRFVALEGELSQLQEEYSIHGLGDQNYFRLDLEVDIDVSGDILTVPIIADVENTMTDVNLNETVFSHGEAGLAQQVLVNMNTDVFRIGDLSVLATEWAENIDLQVYPNPSSGGEFYAVFDHRIDNLSLSIADIQGKQLVKDVQVVSGQAIDISRFQRGLYLVSFFVNAELQEVRKLLVH